MARGTNRRAPNGDQVRRIAGLATKHKPSVDFTGYWQRHIRTVQDYKRVRPPPGKVCRFFIVLMKYPMPAPKAAPPAAPTNGLTTLVEIMPSAMTAPKAAPPAALAPTFSRSLDGVLSEEECCIVICGVPSGFGSLMA